MKHSTPKIIIAVALFVGIIAVGWWMFNDPTDDIVMSNPGEDNRGKPAFEVVVNIGEFFQSFKTIKNDLKESWPCFRGESRDNISKSNIPLIDEFGPNGADTIWSLELGQGYAGAAIYQGLVYLLDYNEEKRADVLRCFDLLTGEEQWQRWYNVKLKRNHGLSRTVPAVTEDYILSMGPKCHLMCVDRKSGDFLWGLDIAKDYESEVPGWYTGQCPLIDNDVAIIATGGKALMIGIDCKTGEVLWEVPNPDLWKMSHSSVVPYTFEGEKMYVYSAQGGVFGVGAKGENEGKLLWKTNQWNHNTVAPSAVCMPDGKIYLTAGYGAGSMMLQLSKTDAYQLEVLSELKPREGLSSEQQTPLYYKGHLIAVMPKDGGEFRQQMVCVHPDDISQEIWVNGKENRFMNGYGPYMIADDKIWVLNDEGTLSIYKASVESFRLMDKEKILDGHDAWAPLALADGFMLLRDDYKMVCVDLRSGK